MDNTEVQEKIILQHRRNPDGTMTVRKKPIKRKKIVIAKVRRSIFEPSKGAVIASQLLPFRKSMIRQLKSRGYNAGSMKFKNIIPLYFNEFVSKQGNKKSPFQPIDSYEFINNVAFKIKPNDSYDNFRTDLACDHLGGVVDNIVEVFKTAKLKKRLAVLQGIDPKEVLTDEELIQAKEAERVERELKEKEDNDKSFKLGQVKNILIIAIVVFSLYYLFK